MTDAATYLALSYATLDKHAASGAFSTIAALRLLRRNARDIAPYAPYVEQARIARQLLRDWQSRAIRSIPQTTDSE